MRSTNIRAPPRRASLANPRKLTRMLGRMLKSWCTLHRPDMLGCLWMAVLLGSLTWLDFRDGGIF
jgi:hypothetical protein